MVDDKRTLKSVIGRFIEAYEQRDRETDYSVWLEDMLRQELPELPEGSEQKIVQDIVAAVAAYDKMLVELDEAMDAGMSKEEWFAEQMAEGCASMEYDDAGEKLLQIEQGITALDVQLMQEIDGTQQYSAEEADASLIEWNQYSIKRELHEIGKKACFAGLVASANAVRCREEADGEITIGDAVREAILEDMTTAPHEVKAVVAGAVKVVAEKRLEDTLPFDTSIEDISDMAGVAVESAEALFDAANGEINGLEAVDRIGRAGVVSACRIGKRTLQGCLVKVPLVGPLLVDVFGGLLEHMESQTFYENVYTVVHDAAVATWEGIKDFGSRTVQKATNVITMLFG
ncbi:MAG: hypothetical protein K2O32_08510 [Acetatifactor sp.]|nr:hypothetical protein [Acetatifactor sp.]